VWRDRLWAWLALRYGTSKVPLRKNGNNKIA